MNCENPRNKYAKAQDHDEGDERRGGYNSRRVQGWLAVTLNFHSVEFQLARGVVEMVPE